MTDTLSISAKAREAAADLFDRHCAVQQKSTTGPAARMRYGTEDEHPFVAAFARFEGEITAPLIEALEWYAEQAAGCRKIGNLGEPFQQALDADGGKRARAALQKERNQ